MGCANHEISEELVYRVQPLLYCFTKKDLLGTSARPFLRISRCPLGIEWNTSSLWLTRQE